MAFPFLTNISTELIEKILRDGSIDFKDLCHVSRTCSKLWEICQSSTLWKFKFKMRWPEVYKKIDDSSVAVTWQDKCKCGYHIQIKTKHILLNVASNCYKVGSEVSEDDFEDYYEPLIVDDLSLRLCVASLRPYVEASPRHIEKNLTLNFYGQRIYLCFQHKLIHKDMMELLEKHPLSSSISALETGAVYFSKWFEPDENISEETIDAELTAIAKMVQEELATQYKDHPAVKHPLLKKGFDLHESRWNPRECRIVLETLNYVLYQRIGFHGASSEHGEMYDYPQNSYIHVMLRNKVGIPITLCILYAAIAYRLGVLCMCVNCPAHFMLKFLDKPDLDTEEAFTYIDAFNGGKMSNRVQMGSYHPCRPQPSRSPVRLSTILERMCRNLINAGRQEAHNLRGLNYTLRNALELLVILTPDDVEIRLILVRLNVNINVNLRKSLQHIKVIVESNSTTNDIAYWKDHILSQIGSRKPSVRKRARKVKHARTYETQDVKYKTGMIMRHKRYEYKCVIYGWDPRCAASGEWIRQMRVDRLHYSEYQPFYNVLVEDGSNRYAAQENLIPEQNPVQITHWEVGRYFRAYKEEYGYYLSNVDLYDEYPDDGITSNDFIRRKSNIS